MTSCSHCGKEPLRCRNDAGEIVEVDACFEGAFFGGWPVSGCCGHGDQGRAYVRLEVRREDGTFGSVDLCGFVVQGYGAFIGMHDFAEHYPPKNVA